MIAIEFDAIGLAKRSFIPIEIDPAHAVENGLNRVVCGAALVGVFDTKDEDPILLPRKKAS